MWTLSYKGAFIHGYCERKECKVQYGPNMFVRGPFPSLDAAKRFIRQAIKNGDHNV
ncbi:hypothetical protein HYPP_02644 [Hyphomicrobium sp. ghe19]|nr:hypothetical protein HYPP_02644 [Hyphomicrobium sp. ghe19]